MTIDQRVWKTGLLAVALTLVFAIVVFRIDDWSAGFIGRVSVFGQGGQRRSPLAVSKIIPHIAVGSYDDNGTKYATTIQILNPGQSTVTVRGNFYDPKGEPSDLKYTTSDPSASTIQSGVLNDISLAANSTMVITGALPTTTPAVYKGNWARIESSAPVLVTTLYEVREPASNRLLSRVGVAGSSVLNKFAIQRVRNVNSGLDVAFAIANAGTTTANLTATLRDAAGASIATKTLVLIPGQQTAQVLGQFFGIPELNSTTFYSFVTFDGGPAAELGAVAIAYEGVVQTTFPVEPLP
jgi:hypothetical protein